MKKELVVFLCVILFTSFIVFKYLVYYLFPDTGLGRIFTFLIVGVLTILIIIYFYKRTKNAEKVIKIFNNFSLSLLLILIFSFCIEFQEFRNSIPIQIYNSVKMVFWDYQYVNETDLYLPKNIDNFSRYDCIVKNSQERYVASLWKYRKKIKYGNYYLYNETSYYISYKEINPIIEKEEDICDKLQTGQERLLYIVLKFFYK